MRMFVWTPLLLLFLLPCRVDGSRGRQPLSALLLLDTLALSVQINGAGGLDGLVLEDPTGTAGAAAPAAGGLAGMTLGAPLGEGEEAFTEEDARKQEQLMSKIEQRKAEIAAQTASGSARAKSRMSGSDVRDSMLKRKKITSGAESDDPTDQLPLRERIAARKAERKAERAAEREAEQLGAQGGILAWFRVDEGGAVSFRNSPSLTDRSDLSAQPGDLIEVIDVREGIDDPGEWVQHRENKLWLPVRFLLPVEEPGGKSTPSADCVDKNDRCAKWAADGDCEKNLKFVRDSCPRSCGLCEMRQAKQQRKQERSGGNADSSRSSNARRLEEEAEAAAAAMLGVGTAASATYPTNSGGMAAAAAAVDPPAPPQASFRLEVEELHGCETATDVPIRFVLPDGFTLGVDGRACFDIFRAPLGVTTETGQLYHSRQDETPYVESACFSKMQILTASDTPHGSYRVLGTLYTMDGRILQRTEDAPYGVITLFRVVPAEYTAWAPSFDWAPVAAWQQLPPGVDEMIDERETRLARIPPTWSLRLVVETEQPSAVGPGTVEMEVAAETTIGDLRAAANVVATAAAAAAVAKLRAAGESTESLASWAQCGAEGTIPISLGRVNNGGTVELFSDVDDVTPLVNVTWFRGGGLDSAAALRATAGVCQLDTRVDRLRKANDEDLIVLEMVLQQFGLGICMDGDEELEAVGGCHPKGWTGDDLRDVLIAAVVGQEQRQRQQPPQQQ